jgi:hypothetical protein
MNSDGAEVIKAYQCALALTQINRARVSEARPLGRTTLPITGSKNWLRSVVRCNSWPGSIRAVAHARAWDTQAQDDTHKNESPITAEIA